MSFHLEEDFLKCYHKNIHTLLSSNPCTVDSDECVGCCSVTLFKELLKKHHACAQFVLANVIDDQERISLNFEELIGKPVHKAFVDFFYDHKAAIREYVSEMRGSTVELLPTQRAFEGRFLLYDGTRVDALISDGICVIPQMTVPTDDFVLHRIGLACDMHREFGVSTEDENKAVHRRFCNWILGFTIFFISWTIIYYIIYR